MTDKEEKETIRSEDSQDKSRIGEEEVMDKQQKKDEELVEEEQANNKVEDTNVEGKEKEAKEVQEEEPEKRVDTPELLDTIDKLEENIKSLEEEKEVTNNRLLRLQADFSNYKKRKEKEMASVYSNALVELIEDLLPVLDNFERALAQEDSGDDFRKGVEMIYKQFMNFLEKQGVKQIEAVGKEFDHNYHNAVMQVETDEFDSGIVVDELQKGYIVNEIVIRPSMVKVAE